jgi:hypothetical protein
MSKWRADIRVTLTDDSANGRSAPPQAAIATEGEGDHPNQALLSALENAVDHVRKSIRASEVFDPENPEPFDLY